MELHLIKGTKPDHNPTRLPDTLKQRIPYAEWMDNPDAWNKKIFITETADFLYTVYGIGAEQDKHTLTMLADQMELYIACSKGIKQNGIITKFNNDKTIGPNPFITIRNNALKLTLQIMNELGLTPRGRLSSNKIEDNSPVAQFLKGPFAQ